MIEIAHPSLGEAAPGQYEAPDWAELLMLYREEARHAPSPRRAARHLVEIARIHEEHLGDVDEARRAYEEARSADPSDTASLRGLRRLAEARSDWGAVRGFLDAELGLATQDLPRASLHLRLGVLAKERLNDLDLARRHLRTAADLSPDDPEILLRLELVTPEDDVHVRVELLGRRLRLTEDGRARTQLLLEMGRLTETSLESEEDALALYQEALQVAPGSRDAIEGIIRLYLRAGRSAELVAALMQLVTQVNDHELRGRLMYLSAILCLTRLEQYDRVPLLMGQAAVLLSGDSTVLRELVADYESLAMWGPANALLETLASQDSGEMAASAWYRAGLNAEVGLGNQTQALDAYRRALQIVPAHLPSHAAMRRLSLRSGDGATVRAATEALADLSDDPGTRAALLTCVADQIETDGGSPEEALRTWQAALNATSQASGPLGDGAPIQAVRRLTHTKATADELVRVLEAWLAHPLETDARRAALGALAEIQEIHLEDPRAAIRALQQLLECAPDDVGALRNLQRLCMQTADLPGAISAAERELSCIADVPRQLALLMRNAELLDELGEPRRAEEAWRRALELEPRFLPGLMGLGRLLYHHGRWHDLAALHRHELKQMRPDEPERAGILGRLAEVLEFRLELLDDAAACYEEILTLRPKAPDALAGLERLYGARDRHAELARVLRLRVEHVEEPRDRAVLLFRLGELEHEYLGDLESALDHYESALELHPGLVPAIWALERLVIALDDRERQVMLFRGLLAGSEQPAQRAMLAHKLALLLSPAEARPIYEELIAQSGEEPSAVWALYRDAAERGDRAEVASRLSRLAQWVQDRKDAVLLWREAAENADEAARDLPIATRVALWERVASLEPTQPRAWEALHRLRRLDGDPGERAGFLLQLGRATDDDRAASVTRWTSGLIYDRAGGGDAVGQYREAASLSGDDPVPVWMLLLQAERAGVGLDRAELQIELAQRRLADVPAAIELTAAGVYFLEVAGDRERALSVLQDAAARDPDNLEAAARVELLLRSLDRLPDLGGFLVRRLRRLQDEAEIVPVARRLADLQLGPLGDAQGARLTLERLSELLPSDYPIAWQLAELLVSLGEPREAAITFERALTLAPDDRARAQVFTRLGQLRARQLNDVHGAVDVLRMAVGLLDPDGQALEELAAIYLLTGESESALLAYERLERQVADISRVQAAQAGQIRALIAAGKIAEARGRLDTFRRRAPRSTLLNTLDISLASLEPSHSDILVTDPAAAPLPQAAIAAARTGGTVETGPVPMLLPSPTPMQGSVATAESIAPPRTSPPPLPPRPPALPIEHTVDLEVSEVEDALDVALASTAPLPVVADRVPPPRPWTGSMDTPRHTGPPPPPPGRGAPPPPPPRSTLPPPVGPVDALGSTAIGFEAIHPAQRRREAESTAPPIPSAPSVGPPPVPPPVFPDAGIRQTVPYGLPALPIPPEGLPAPSSPPPAVPPIVAPPSLRTEHSGVHETDMGMPVTRIGVVGRIDTVQAEVDPAMLARTARTRIEGDPLDVHAWRDLVRAMNQRGHTAAARWCGDALSWLEGTVVSGTPQSGAGALPEGLRRPLLPPTVPSAILQLLRQIGPWVTPPFCADAGRHGVTAQDLVGDTDPLSTIARRMGDILGVEAYMLLRNPSRPYTVAVEAGDPSAIVLGSAILDGAPDTARSFLVARCLVPLGEGTLLARKLTDREFGAFLAALLGLLGAEFPVRARDRATYDRMRAQLEPTIPAHRRTPLLAELARASAQSLQSLPAAALRVGLETYAARLALAITDGCGGALEMLRRQDFDDRPRSALSRADLVQFVADSDTARDLLVFASSPACEAIRTWMASER